MARKPIPGAPPIPTAAQTRGAPAIGELLPAEAPAAPRAAAAPPPPPAPAVEGSNTALEAMEAAVASASAKAVAEAEAHAENLDEPHPEHPLLTRREVMDVQAQARSDLIAKQRANAKKALLASETLRLAQEEGLTTGSSINDQPVSITLDLAEHSDRIVINGRPYYHGYTYTVPRHIADNLAEIQYRGWKHQDEIDGKDLVQHYQRQRLTTMSQVTGVAKNAPAKFDA